MEPHARVPVRILQHPPAGQRAHGHIYQRGARTRKVTGQRAHGHIYQRGARTRKVTGQRARGHLHQRAARTRKVTGQHVFWFGKKYTLGYSSIQLSFV